VTELRPVRGRRIAALLAVLSCALSVGPTFAAASAQEPLQLSSDLRVLVSSGRDIELELRCAAQDDWISLSERATGDARQADALAAWNSGSQPAPDAWIRIPLALLTEDYRRFVMQSLFPRDRQDGEDWLHIARAGERPTYDEGLWQVAEWFSGDGRNFERLMQDNGLSSPELREGQSLRIAAELLLPAFRRRLVSDTALLEFHADHEGPYAGYRLRAGEALYSSVVVQFTGRTQSDDVTAMAELIRKRSGIRDLTDIPVGFLIKIPLDLVEWPFLPKNHPRRIAGETERAERERELARQPPEATRGGLEGVVLVLDPGHGGRDLGTMHNGIWEHDYVYDVACRLKTRLERETRARVVMTLIDTETGCSPSATDKLEANQKGSVRVDPPFMARKKGEAKIGVNLRWYLANSIYRKALADGVKSERVIFISLHADSRHASLRGLMVYVPGASYRTKTYGMSSKVYDRYREVREKRHVRFSKKQRLRSEAISTRFGEAVVAAYRRAGLPVQPHQPLRNRIIRGKQRFVPAVLRSNAIPNKVLVEMLNLSNREDAAMLGTAANRNRLADGVFDALLDYFGEKPKKSR